jgi:hypothetical protein
MLSDDSKINRSRRRQLVIVWYAASLAVGIFTLWGPHWLRHNGFNLLLPLLIIAAGTLGGVRPGGLVRPFSPAMARTAYNTPLTQLFLEARPRRSGEEGELDERDVAIRNQAHFVAMNYLRAAALVFLAVILLFAGDPAQLLDTALLGSYLLFLLVMTLPQAIILWTEPDPEDPGTQTGVRIYPQENRHA